DRVAQRLHLAEPPVELLLDVLDRDVLVEDRAQRGEADERLLDAADRNTENEIRRPALGTGAVLDAAHVAAEPARQAKRTFGRRREALHLQRQLGLVELRPAGCRREGATGVSGCLQRSRRVSLSLEGRENLRGRGMRAEDRAAPGNGLPLLP